MILTTHAIVGASVAQFFPNQPILAFSAGFVSHFILDAIPHKDYDLRSLQRDERNCLNNRFVYNKKFVLDLLKISVDLSAGFLLVYLAYLFHGDFNLLAITLAGAIGAVLPDFLQFIYFNFKHEPLISLQKFHVRIQKDTSSVKRGIFSQLAVVLFFSLVTFVLS